jgi:hypothetical protein
MESTGAALSFAPDWSCLTFGWACKSTPKRVYNTFRFGPCVLDLKAAAMRWRIESRAESYGRQWSLTSPCGKVWGYFFVWSAAICAFERIRKLGLLEIG